VEQTQGNNTVEESEGRIAKANSRAMVVSTCVCRCLDAVRGSLDSACNVYEMTLYLVPSRFVSVFNLSHSIVTLRQT
jgi:hypothetical protein